MGRKLYVQLNSESDPPETGVVDASAQLAVHEVPPGPGCLQLVWTIFAGALFIASVFCVVYAQNHPLGPFRPSKNSPLEGRLVFACLMQVLFFAWVVPINLHIFFRSRINVMPLLARRSQQARASKMSMPHPSQPAFLATVGTTVMGFGLIVYAYVFRSNHSEQIHHAPVAPVVLQFIIFVTTMSAVALPLLYYPSQRRLFKTILECLATAIGYPIMNREIKFFHSLVADGITSSTLMIFQLEYSICHFATTSWTSTLVKGADGMLTSDPCGAGSNNYKIIKPILYALPYWIRFLQSVYSYIDRAGCTGWERNQHFWNALKYSTALAVVITSTLSTSDQNTILDNLRSEPMTMAWFIMLVIKTVYCFVWDILVDWKLGHKKHGFLRKNLLFSQHKWAYYFAMATNLLARVTWSFAISPRFCSSSCSLLFGVLEIARRAQWNVFRMERAYFDRLDAEKENTEALLPVQEDSDDDMMIQ